MPVALARKWRLSAKWRMAMEPEYLSERTSLAASVCVPAPAYKMYGGFYPHFHRLFSPKRLGRKSI